MRPREDGQGHRHDEQHVTGEVVAVDERAEEGVALDGGEDAVDQPRVDGHLRERHQGESQAEQGHEALEAPPGLAPVQRGDRAEMQQERGDHEGGAAQRALRVHGDRRPRPRFRDRDETAVGVERRGPPRRQRHQLRDHQREEHDPGQ